MFYVIRDYVHIYYKNEFEHALYKLRVREQTEMSEFKIFFIMPWPQIIKNR